MENEKLFEFMTQMYSEIKEGFNKLNLDIGRLDSEMKEVKKTVLHIEQDHGKKLEVIFDGLTQHTEQLNRIEERLNQHDEILLKRIK